MCTGVEIALAAAAIGGTAAGVKQSRDMRKEASAQRDSLLRAEAERKAAQDRAAQDAQAQVADRRRRMRSQSLLTTGATGPVDSGSALSYGKSTLGG